MAAHIYAASDDGPRGTGGLSADERSSEANGIWVCYLHGKSIDSDDGSIYSASQLKAWKRIHEARKAGDVDGIVPDHCGLVDYISIESAPATLAGRRFDLSMRNLITGENNSGKTILARLLTSVAKSHHVADLSRHADVDFGVQWLDPRVQHVATQGRGGHISHTLNGRRVPYVARPYKVILIEGHQGGHRQQWGTALHSVAALARLFDLSVPAMRATLELLPESGVSITKVDVTGDKVQWTVGQRGMLSWIRPDDILSGVAESLIFVELAAFHARHHAEVEPTLLILDEPFAHLHWKEAIRLLERLERAAEYAQLAVISVRPDITAVGAEHGWTLAELGDSHRQRTSRGPVPIDFEIQTTSTPTT